MSPGESDCKTIKNGEISPGPNSAARMSNACREGRSGGRIVASGDEMFTRRKGDPSNNSSARVGISTATGLAITPSERRTQNPLLAESLVDRQGRENRSIPVPTTESNAGKSVSAATVDQATTMTPAIPTERRNMNSNSDRPINPIKTVAPEKKTALPAVATVCSTASGTLP